MPDPTRRSATRPSAGTGRTRRWFALAFTVLSLGAPAGAQAQDFLVPRMDVAAPAGAKTLCRQYAWACARSGPALHDGALRPAEIDLARQINLSVNRRVRSLTDEAQYRKPELWALPTARGGDCEDFALLKKRELMARGLAPENLLITTVLDRKRESHAVLVLRTVRGDLVLDNLTDRVVGWRETGYTFLRMQNPDDPRRWNAVIAGALVDDRAFADERPVSAIPASRD